MATGDHILITDEATRVAKELWAANLQATEINMEEGTVSGIYDPTRKFWIEVDEQEPVGIKLTGENWLATFTELSPGTCGFVAQDDDDADGTVWDPCVLNPQ